MNATIIPPKTPDEGEDSMPPAGPDEFEDPEAIPDEPIPNRPRDYVLDPPTRQRTPKGQWPKGVSGLVRGREKKTTRTTRHVAYLARGYTVEALARLVEFLRRGNREEQFAAAIALLDRGWGRPAQAVEISGPNAGPIPVIHGVTDLRALAARYRPGITPSLAPPATTSSSTLTTTSIDSSPSNPSTPTESKS